MQYFPSSAEVSLANSNVSIPWNTVVASEKEFVAFVLKTLDKLKQRDTQKTSSDILFAIAATYKFATTAKQDEYMIPKFELLNSYVTCLLEYSDQQNALYKRELLRVLAQCCTTLLNDMQPYLTRIVTAITKFLKDKDSNVRDSCVDFLEVSCQRVEPPLVGGKDALSVYFKPLFSLVSEQDKNLQQGAVMCIASVIRNSKEVHLEPYVTRVMNAFQKTFQAPSCPSRPQILNALGDLMERTKKSVTAGQYIPAVIGMCKEAFDANDWGERKGAAECLKFLSKRQDVSPYIEDIVALLESNKFDKIKPVRDAVTDALSGYVIARNVAASDSPDRRNMLIRSTSSAVLSATVTGAIHKKPDLTRSSAQNYRSLPQTSNNAPMQRRATISDIRKHFLEATGASENPPAQENDFDENNTAPGETEEENIGNGLSKSLPERGGNMEALMKQQQQQQIQQQQREKAPSPVKNQNTEPPVSQEKKELTMEELSSRLSGLVNSFEVFAQKTFSKFQAIEDKISDMSHRISNIENKLKS